MINNKIQICIFNLSLFLKKHKYENKKQICFLVFNIFIVFKK
jgi:hypothetical protein